MSVASKLIEQMKSGKTADDAISSVVKKSPVANKGLMLLSYLRPNDKFTFIAFQVENDFPGITPDTLCTVIPAERGSIAFTANNENAINMPLEDGFKYSVLLHAGDNANQRNKFIEQDRVQHKVNNKYGKVLLPLVDDLYLVQFETEPDPVQISGNLLYLTDKDKTTQNYIAKVGDSWMTSFQPAQLYASQLDAIKFLYRKNRTAFYRYSKLAHSGAIEIDEKSLQYLQNVDSRLWQNV